MTTGRPIATGTLLDEDQLSTYAMMMTPPQGSDRPTPVRQLVDAADRTGVPSRCDCGADWVYTGSYQGGTIKECSNGHSKKFDIARW